MTRSTAESSPPECVDVLILTALELEYAEVLQVHTGAWEGSQWERRKSPTGFNVAFRTFKATNGAPLHVAVTRALEMGGAAAAHAAAAALVTAYRPSCLAMCGVCIGQRGKVRLGDVIIADQLWSYDTGKLKVTYNLSTHWKQEAMNFQPPAGSPWLSARPPDGLPAPEPFRVHLAPIGTGNLGVKDSEISNQLSESMRRVLGLEMEGTAIGDAFHPHVVPYMLVMKGVMGFVGSDTSDHFKFKSFAARASAECLIAFLRENPPHLYRAGSRGESGDEDHIALEAGEPAARYGPSEGTSHKSREQGTSPPPPALRRKGGLLVYDGDLASGESWPSIRELRETRVEELAKQSEPGGES